MLQDIYPSSVDTENNADIITFAIRHDVHCDVVRWLNSAHKNRPTLLIV